MTAPSVSNHTDEGCSADCTQGQNGCEKTQERAVRVSKI